jgi:hypothetical protein
LRLRCSNFILLCRFERGGPGSGRWKNPQFTFKPVQFQTGSAKIPDQSPPTQSNVKFEAPHERPSSPEDSEEEVPGTSILHFTELPTPPEPTGAPKSWTRFKFKVNPQDPSQPHPWPQTTPGSVTYWPEPPQTFVHSELHPDLHTHAGPSLQPQTTVPFPHQHRPVQPAAPQPPPPPVNLIDPALFPKPNCLPKSAPPDPQCMYIDPAALQLQKTPPRTRRHSPRPGHPAARAYVRELLTASIEYT